MEEYAVSWEILMAQAVRAMLYSDEYKDYVDWTHTQDTPMRVVKAYKEYFAGCTVDIAEILKSTFPSNHNQMVIIKGILFHSVCAHHLALISGMAHFAYIPNLKIIGISKIPRLVDALARRPQVQEAMSDQIVDNFMKYVEPQGCGVVVSASHACMQCRGARAQNAITETNSLRGTFLENPSTKQEFLMAVRNGR
jgi:GTP cyclohydrolase I